MKALLLVESVNQTDPQSTAKQDAENCNNDGVGLGAAVFRLVSGSLSSPLTLASVPSIWLLIL
ncbi:MAG: hypothetical protein EBV86_09380 [Marivivens sp.]|nr:hypothetical protein [Marivivens sp.]